MKKIAIIASNNGLGHIRRCVALANNLSNKFNVSIYCSVEKVKIFKVKKKIKVIDFNINFYKKKISIKKNNIHNYFNFKKKYDLYLSDNYPEVALKNNKSVILSNFFWHDILKVNTDYYKRIEKKISNRPIIPNYLFCSKYIKKKFKIHPVGFYGKFENQIFDSKKKGILISFGTAKFKKDKQIKNLKNVLKNRVNKKFPIYLEPDLYSNSFRHENVFEAKYDKEMYSKIAVAIIKPGLGTITDCLMRGVTILTYIKGQNKEFIENARILEENNIGINFNYLNSALEFASNILKEKIFLKYKFDIAKNLKWNGEKEVIKIIEKIFKNKLLITKNTL